MYAGFWLRAIALIIDGIVIKLTLGIALSFLFPQPSIQVTEDSFSASMYFEQMGNPENWLHVVGLWLYFTLLESSSWQATVGKKILSLKVTDLNGNRIGLGQANIRYWSKLLSFVTLFVGYILAGLTQRKQALHDLIAKTLVVRN